MNQANHFQELAAPVQKLFSDSVFMALAGFEVTQAQWKSLLESAYEQGAATTKDSLRYAEELRGRLTEFSNSANDLVREQAALFNDLPKDPLGASQKVISGYVEASRKALEGGAEALKAYVNLVNDLWSRLEKASQDTRGNYVTYVGKLQAIVESTLKNN
ncbi:MAG: hypothetical protein ACM362_07980 [Candidatus Methylomirabilota bacterium]